MHKTLPGAGTALGRIALPLFAICGLAALAGVLPARGQTDEVETPAERPATTTTIPPAEPVTEDEMPAEPREVLVPAQPEGPKRREKQKFRFGPDVELFLPTSSKTSDRYGNSWFGFGAGFGSVRPEGLLGTWSGEVYLIHNREDHETWRYHEAYVIPIGVAYRRALLDRLYARPYVGASANLVLANFNSPMDGIPWGLRVGGGGSVLAGVTFRRTGYIEARYLLVSEMKGLDFSGVNLTGGLRF